MEIDKFDNFLDKYLESFNTSVDIKWIDKIDLLIGLFCINDKVYQINCVDKGDGIWTYKFYHYDPNSKVLLTRLTNFNTGKLSVISTVREGMDYLIKLKNPKCLIYAASDKSEARKKLYFGFAEEIELNYGYKFNTALYKDKQVYVLFKPDMDKLKIDDVLKKLIDEIIEDF